MYLCFGGTCCLHHQGEWWLWPSGSSRSIGIYQPNPAVQKTVLDTHCCEFPVYQFSLKMIVDKCLGASLFTDVPPLFHSSNIPRVCMSEIIATVPIIWINYCTIVHNHFMRLRAILFSLIISWQCDVRSTVLLLSST
jgi:hypothetical protein